MSMKLKRTIQEWRNLDPVNIAQRQGRPVAKHALVDAKHDILALAAKVEELAAAAVQGEPGVKWAPEEVANGNKGIRWVSDEGVHGRPTDHDCRVYLESNPNARGCHCPECTMLYTAPQPAEREIPGSYPVSGQIFFREPSNEWVLELTGSVNGTTFTARHTQPADTRPEDVAGLSTLHSEREKLRKEAVVLMAALEGIKVAATHKSIRTGIQAGTALGLIAALCDFALAAHRKQESNNE